MADARAAADTPLQALTALARAYVRFSQENPGYFRLMFRPELSQPDKHPDAGAAGDAAFDVLADTIADAVAAGLLSADMADTLAVMWWSLAHGMASLWLDGQLEKRSIQLGTAAPTLVEDIMRTFTALVGPGA
ncbi:TetR-like C-terminal domain-containing protein [Nocardia sp. CA-129566]|uniref:TetR-like C-terminal domain-containing protein n=1 Tax=Nocardia sp. CA-129566 TaxID=3239976 RepID=UPI003D983EFE